MDASTGCTAAGVVLHPARPKKRTGTSKYDFIKVKVWLGDNMDHYYILSRFLICRMLTVTRIPYIKAVKISLETKKFLVDNNLHDVTQAQLEDVLFSIVRSKGFDEAHIDCYRMVTQFYQSRQPLCIIICGAAWTGKSTLAQQLASRINIPNVMQTDVIYELLRSGPDSPLHPVPLWARPGLAGGRCCDAALVREFRREARVVREGMEGDLIKTLSDGKPIIIEGFHLDPGLYIQDFAARGLIMLPSRPNAAVAAATAASAAAGGLQAAAAAGRSPGSSPVARRGRYGRSQTLPSRSATPGAGCAATAVAGAAGTVQLELLEEEHDTAEQQQQQLVQLRDRSASASAEVSVSVAGPLSPGAWARTAGPGTVDAALGLLQCTGAQEAADQGAPSQQRQPHRLYAVSQALDRSEQPLPPLPPLPPLRVRQQGQQDVNACSSCGSMASSTVQSPSFVQPNAASMARPACPVQQPVHYKKQQGTPFADIPAADAVLAAAAVPTSGVLPASNQPVAAVDVADVATTAAGGADSLFSSPEQLPVVMLGEVQVCAAAAEAAALQQHRQELQQQQQQQHPLPQQRASQAAPGSPFSSASDVSSVGVGGSSPPCISQEHSTTEVVSRMCSCASLGSPAYTLSQEPSAAELCSPPAATAAGGGGGEPGGCGAAARRHHSGMLNGQQGPSTQRMHRSPKTSMRQLPCSSWLPDQQQQREPELLSQQHQGLQHVCSKGAGDARRCACAGATSACAGPAGAAAESPHANGAATFNGQETDACSTLDPQQGAARGSPIALSMCSQQHMAATAAAATDEAAAAAAAVADDGTAARAAEHSPTAMFMTGSGPCKEQQEANGVDNTPPYQPALHSEQLPPQRVANQQQQHVANPCSGQQQGKVGEPEPVGKPLFVPILVYMDEADHALMADEALAHLGLSAGKAATGGDGISAGSDKECAAAVNSCMHTNGAGGVPVGGTSGVVRSPDLLQQQLYGGVTVAEALRRVRLLQEYLCAYEAQGLPVVRVSYGAFGEALDKLHEYVLQCIKVAMSSRQATA